MPKPSDKRLRQYPSLKEIPAEEWDEIFENYGQEWTVEDEEYLVEWICKGAVIVDRIENIIDLSYQLGRTPFSIQDKLRKMRNKGRIPYFRKVVKHDG